MRLIDADALMKVVKMHHYPIATRNNSVDKGMFTVGIQQIVNEAPTISPESLVKRGEWVNPPLSGTKTKNPYWFCSHCGNPVNKKKRSNYCPSCGVRMEGNER